jgi:hypothetical protein
LVTYLQENEAALLTLTGAFTDLINNALERFIEWVDGGGIDRFVTGLQEAVTEVQELYNFLKPAIDLVTKFALPVYAATQPHAIASNMGRKAGEVAGKVGNWLGDTFGKAREAAGPFADRQAGDVSGTQNVHVTVGVDPRNGSVQPYVDQQINQNNAALVGGGGIANTRAAGSGSMR